VAKLDGAIVHTNPALADGTDPHAALAHHRQAQAATEGRRVSNYSRT
jgi:hypothetical protein